MFTLMFGKFGEMMFGKRANETEAARQADVAEQAPAREAELESMQTAQADAIVASNEAGSLEGQKQAWAAAETGTDEVLTTDESGNVVENPEELIATDEGVEEKAA